MLRIYLKGIELADKLKEGPEKEELRVSLAVLC